MTALRVGFAALVALMLLQVVWHVALFPPAAHRLPMVVLTVLPLALSLWSCRRALRRGVLIGGIVCLAYFCHGVSAAWSDAQARAPALLEAALAVLVVGALGWDARGFRRR